ncbi:DUF2627 domain-containing protein [Virgibacillus sp. LDC-1]|uniref:DUF2627 domain-containing protein n=1 Tax=Virgibacillus sp. LDC-1 TaxID=3039856 RepID=UPI0024DEDAA9|nr:DUF2627 domain-containing protein [Virgibacillus sp. LDC-1]
MGRIIAVLLLVIPGIFSAIGIKLMRDALFNEFTPLFIHIGVQFTVGVLLFLFGLAFIGGFIIHRDRKKQNTDQACNACIKNR